MQPTHFHAGEVAAVSPSKPATGGALVNVHILQVDIHPHNAPAREGKRVTSVERSAVTEWRRWSQNMKGDKNHKRQ